MMLSESTMLAIAGGAAQAFELAGIAVIVLGTVLAIGQFVLCTSGLAAPREGPPPDRVASFRKTLGRTILVGLELLVAADIVRTVAVEPTLENVLVLGLIVLIRTFLSFSLEVEIDGKWPWQQAKRQD